MLCLIVLFDCGGYVCFDHTKKCTPEDRFLGGKVNPNKITCTMDVFFCIVRVCVYRAYQERYCT